MVLVPLVHVYGPGGIPGMNMDDNERNLPGNTIGLKSFYIILPYWLDSKPDYPILVSTCSVTVCLDRLAH
jgi:hypothetical protein